MRGHWACSQRAPDAEEAATRLRGPDAALGVPTAQPGGSRGTARRSRRPESHCPPARRTFLVPLLEGGTRVPLLSCVPPATQTKHTFPLRSQEWLREGPGGCVSPSACWVRTVTGGRRAGRHAAGNARPLDAAAGGRRPAPESGRLCTAGCSTRGRELRLHRTCWGLFCDAQYGGERLHVVSPSFSGHRSFQKPQTSSLAVSFSWSRSFWGESSEELGPPPKWFVDFWVRISACLCHL